MEDQSVSAASTMLRERARAIREGRATRSELVLPPEFRAPLHAGAQIRRPFASAAEARAAFGIRADAGAADEFTGPETATACLEVHLGSYPIEVQVVVDLTSPNPYNILKGSATGAILSSGPEFTPWQVSGYVGIVGVTIVERVLDDELLLIAEQASITVEDDRAEPADSSHAFFVVFGSYMPPLTYPGTLIAGGGGDYAQNTLFKGWQACS